MCTSRPPTRPRPSRPPPSPQAQGDPFTQFNEPASAASVAAGAPSVNINGVPAAAASATSVPVMGTLAAPLPGTGYAAGYAPGVRAAACSRV